MTKNTTTSVKKEDAPVVGAGVINGSDMVDDELVAAVANRIRMSFLPSDSVQNIMQNIRDSYTHLVNAAAGYDRVIRTKYTKNEAERVAAVPVLSMDSTADGRTMVRTDFDLKELPEEFQKEVLTHLASLSRTRVHSAAHVLAEELMSLINAVQR